MGGTCAGELGGDEADGDEGAGGGGIQSGSEWVSSAVFLRLDRTIAVGPVALRLDVVDIRNPRGSMLNTPVITQALKNHGDRKPLRQSHGGKTAVIYCWHEFTRNVRFFMRHGLQPHPKVDYFIAQNMPEWSDDRTVEIQSKWIGRSRVIRIQRPNYSNDFGGYSACLHYLRSGAGDTRLTDYDFVMFLNSTMRGPFVPPAVDPANHHWAMCFTHKLTDQVGLVGSSINFHHGNPHVQSMAMAMDQRTLQLCLESERLYDDDRRLSRDFLIANHEIGISQVVLRAGYNLDCLIQVYAGVDWRKMDRTVRYKPNEFREYDLWAQNHYWGNTLHPYETVFFKTNREYAANSPLNALTYWMETAEYDELRLKSYNLVFDSSLQSKQSPGGGGDGEKMGTPLHALDDMYKDIDHPNYHQPQSLPGPWWAWVTGMSVVFLAAVGFLCLWLLTLRRRL